MGCVLQIQGSQSKFQRPFRWLVPLTIGKGCPNYSILWLKLPFLVAICVPDDVVAVVGHVRRGWATKSSFLSQEIDLVVSNGDVKRGLNRKIFISDDSIVQVGKMTKILKLIEVSLVILVYCTHTAVFPIRE